MNSEAQYQETEIDVLNQNRVMNAFLFIDSAHSLLPGGRSRASTTHCAVSATDCWKLQNFKHPCKHILNPYGH